jgi:hypothetical protein
MINLTRSLAQTLISKKGGNVDHNIRSVILELIDNSIDENCNNIIIKLNKEHDKTYLEIYDDGNGIPDIINILNASFGKKNKIGCKNQGFCDSLAFLSNITGSHEIYTNHNGKLQRLSIDFEDIAIEYNRQLENETENEIDYTKCQDKLNSGVSVLNDKLTKETLKSQEYIYNYLKTTGTIIKIQLYKDFNIEHIDPNYFQYMYSDIDFNLVFLNKTIKICKTENICITNKYKPAIFKLYKSKHLNGNELYKCDNNFDTNKGYFKKVSSISNKDEEEYNKLVKTYKEKETFVAELNFTLISSKDASLQNTIFNESSVENHKKLWIDFKGKILGPYDFPKKIKSLSPRNLLDVRILLKIYDNEILQDIIMSNKSKTNIDSISEYIIKFIEYAKPNINIKYNDDIGRDFKELKDNSKETPGIKDMVKYFNNIQLKETQKQLDIERSKKEAERQKQLDIDKIKANYRPWKTSAYFGVKNCTRVDGISAKDNFISCHYGMTTVDPNQRDSGNGLGTSWRRLTYMNMNEDGARLSEGKIAVEWEMYNCIKEIEKENKDKIRWETKEYFSCHKDIFSLVYKKIRDKMSLFEGSYF